MSAGVPGLPPSSWLESVTQLLDQYRMVALLVLCLAVAVTVWRGREKDFGFWTCWTIVAFCSLTIIGAEINSQFSTVGSAGGTIQAVPNTMVLYSDASNFFVARKSNASFRDRSDYDWVRLGSLSRAELGRVSFIVDQNKKRINRDSTTLAVLNEEIDPAPIRFNLQTSPEEVDALRGRRFGLEMHTPAGTLPYLMDGSRRITGTVWDPDDNEIAAPSQSPRQLMQKSGALLIPRAFAQISSQDIDAKLKSPTPEVRAKMVSEIESNFDLYKPWLNQTLESKRATRDLQLIATASIRSHFKDDVSIVYPTPSQFKFLSESAYNRFVLNGLDPSTPLGFNSRLLINNLQDVRIDQAFSRIRSALFMNTDQLHKSCLALFHLGTHYNWAFLVFERERQDGTTFSAGSLKEINTILEAADTDIPALSEEDRLQAARLDYLRGVIYATIAFLDQSRVDRSLDQSQLLQASRSAFSKFISLIPQDRRAAYRYQSHFDVATKFLQNPSMQALQPSSFTAASERGCSDPSEAS